MAILEDLIDAQFVSRIAELERDLPIWRNAYYNGVPMIPDDVYDARKDELAELKSTSPAVTAIGAPPPEVSEWKKVRHTVGMGSLDKCSTLEELTKWVLDCGGFKQRLIVTEKLDGMSIHVHYESGAFTQAVTRGDGSIGEDISVNVAKMRGVPGRLPKSFTGSVRGEIIVKKSDFAVHFVNDYENTRQAAGGISKRYDGRGCNLLSVLFYQVAEGKDFETEASQFEWLEEMGFRVPNWYVTMMVPGIKTPQDLWVDYQQTKRAELDYEIDGLVVRLDNLTEQIALGEKNGCPKGAIAFKFAPVTRESVIREIQNQTGGMGTITPVAVFDPIRLLGVTVTYASLYNWRYIRELGIDVGASILVARANDVIPRVVRVTKSTGTVAEPPEICPSCGTKTEFDGEHLICPNESECPAQNVGRLKRYVKSLGIKEWGDILIEKLVELELVKTVPDLYRLTETQLSGLDRMGKKSAQNVIRTLWACNPIPLEDLLGSLSIPLCAKTTLKLAVDAGYDTLDKLASVTPTQLSVIDGFGPVKAAALTTWLDRHLELLDDLLELGVQVKPRIKGNLTGKSFCFTGTFSRRKEELENLAKALGADVKNSVSKKLTYLVMAEANSTSSKAQAARKNGTICLSEDEFFKIVGV